MLKNKEQARASDEQNDQYISQPVNIEDEIDENKYVVPNTSLVELRRKKSKVQNFQYADLNPNYLIDQYYYTRYKSEVDGHGHTTVRDSNELAFEYFFLLYSSHK